MYIYIYIYTHVHRERDIDICIHTQSAADVSILQSFGQARAAPAERGGGGRSFAAKQDAFVSLLFDCLVCLVCSVSSFAALVVVCYRIV